VIDDMPDPVYVSLNGLPPGEPIIDTLVAPPGGQDDVPLALEILDHEPFRPLQILLEADLDGDGVYELLASESLRTVIPCEGEQLGDLDGDSDTDSDDIARFIPALLGSPIDLYDEILSDVNCDGAANGIDIEPFVDSVLAGP
jgi:hypothetical protein